MMLKTKNLKQFISSIKNQKVNEINIKYRNLEILINKNFFSQNILKNINELDYKKNNLNNESINKNNNDKIKKNEESETYSTIISPMVGTFYRSPAPNEQPFIKENDIVQQKQTVCIIEAMKLMNEIESEVYGEITDILVNDGDIVDCGQALIKVKIV